MATATLEKVDTPSSLPQSRRVTIAMGLLCLVYLPLLAEYLAGLWSTEHYQFFPLLLIAVAVIVVRRVKALGPLAPGDWRWATLGVGSGLLILAVAILFSSPWLGTVAALLTLPAAAYGMGGERLCRPLIAPWLLLWLLIRLPMNLDEAMVRWLQSVTVDWAGRTLDWLDIVHTRSGNVIEIPGHRLLVEEACSGVHSLFSALAATAILAVWARRPVFVSVLLLASVPVWVLLANIARVVAVAVLRVWWDIPAETGWRHEALGMGVFAAVMLLVLSADRWLLFFTPAQRKLPAARGPTQFAGLERWRRGVPWLAGVCGLLLALQLPLAVAELRRGAGERIDPHQVAELGLAALPEELAPWRRATFSTQQRNPGSNYGEFSQTWRYLGETSEAIVSLDYPFSDLHDLTVCYKAQGWEISHCQAVDGGSVVEVEMRLGTENRHALLMFELFDSVAAAVTAPNPSHRQQFTDRIAAPLQRWPQLLGLAAPANSPGPYCQVQVLATGFSPLTPDQKQSARTLLEASRLTLARGWSSPSDAQPPRSDP